MGGNGEVCEPGNLSSVREAGVVERCPASFRYLMIRPQIGRQRGSPENSQVVALSLGRRQKLFEHVNSGEKIQS